MAAPHAAPNCWPFGSWPQAIDWVDGSNPEYEVQRDKQDGIVR
jgi:hypothetical protein